MSVDEYCKRYRICRCEATMQLVAEYWADSAWNNYSLFVCPTCGRIMKENKIVAHAKVWIESSMEEEAKNAQS